MAKGRSCEISSALVVNFDCLPGVVDLLEYVNEPSPCSLALDQPCHNVMVLLPSCRLVLKNGHAQSWQKDVVPSAVWLLMKPWLKAPPSDQSLGQLRYLLFGLLGNEICATDSGIM